MNDKAKPALTTFANPFFVDQRPGSRVAPLWGQVRPGNPCITVQRRKAGSRRWTTMKMLSTNAGGYWTLSQTVNATTDYRFHWQPTDPTRRRPAR